MIKELIKEILTEELSGQPKSSNGSHPLLGERVLVRARNAGVHIGLLKEAGDFIVLIDSNRIWKWEGAFTLSEVSQNGITGGRVSASVETMTIPKGDVGEIINLTEKAHESIIGKVE